MTNLTECECELSLEINFRPKFVVASQWASSLFSSRRISGECWAMRRECGSVARARQFSGPPYLILQVASCQFLRRRFMERDRDFEYARVHAGGIIDEKCHGPLQSATLRLQVVLPSLMFFYAEGFQHQGPSMMKH